MGYFYSFLIVGPRASELRSDFRSVFRGSESVTGGPAPSTISCEERERETSTDVRPRGADTDG